MAHYVALINGKKPDASNNGGVTDADLSYIAVDFLTPGVLLSGYYQVTQQTTPDMTVKVAPGTAYVFNAAFSMAYHTVLDTSANVSIGANSSGNPRVDAIVIKIDLAVTPDKDGSNVATIVAVQGTAAASPVAPTDSEIQTAIGAGNAFLRLANVTVANGATSISSANIADARSLVTSKLSGGDGWNAAGETWSYASADDPTFTFTVSGDKTSKYSAGMRIKLTQSTDKFFIITNVVYASGTTTVTVYGGTDYDLTNATITNPSYSTQKAPQGFPLDPTKWTVETRITTQASQGFPTAGTFYNIGTTNISIPIGSWFTEYLVTVTVDLASAGICDFTVSLSTSTSSVSDGDFTAYSLVANTTNNTSTVMRRKTLNLTSKTTYSLIAKQDNGGTGIYFQGNTGATIIRAVCAYL